MKFYKVFNLGYITSRSQMHQLFLETDLVIAPASCDPFPTFLMEAMNYGVPCVVSNQDGMPEIVDYVLNGVVIDQLTPSSLATSVINLLNHLVQLDAMSQAARYKIRTQLNLDTVAHQITQALSISIGNT